MHNKATAVKSTKEDNVKDWLLKSILNDFYNNLNNFYKHKAVCINTFDYYHDER